MYRNQISSLTCDIGCGQGEKSWNKIFSKILKISPVRHLKAFNNLLLCFFCIFCDVLYVFCGVLFCFLCVVFWVFCGALYVFLWYFVFFVVFCLSKSMKVSDHPPFVGFFSTLRLIKTAKRKKGYIFSSEIHMFGSSIKNEICKRCFCPVLNFKILESLWNAHYEMWTYPIKLTRNVYIVCTKLKICTAIQFFW